MLSGKTVLVGVSGGIAAYKACEVVSGLRKLNAQVRVVMTKNATKFVAPLTFRTLSDNPVYVDMFEEPKVWNVEHIALAESADLLLVCPATANVIGKIACGIADDFLTTTYLACTAPKVICPAMNHNMYHNPVVQGNLKKLSDLGCIMLGPESGRLASGAMGKGRLCGAEVIVDAVTKRLTISQDFSGIKLLVTSGPTREWIDPVRYLSPPSTGKMGHALACAARDRGADVYLVTGPVELEDPWGVQVVNVTTTEEMLDACVSLYDKVHGVIGAAAPSDFKPRQKAAKKIKKSGDNLELSLVPTPDVLKTLAENKGHRVILGFAAETDNILENALKKVEEKNLDFICANPVGKKDVAFGAETNTVSIVYPDGSHEDIDLSSKYNVAVAILDRMLVVLNRRGIPGR